MRRLNTALLLVGLLTSSIAAAAPPPPERTDVRTPMASYLVPVNGDHFTVATLQRMRRIVNDSLVRQPQLVQLAVDIVRDVDGRDPLAQVDALRSWLFGHIEFLPDPLVDGDFLRTPAYVVDEIARTGLARIDCDDAAMFSATLAKAIGLQPRFVVFGFHDRRQPYAHVFTEVLAGGAWHELDVTEPGERRIPPARASWFPV